MSERRRVIRFWLTFIIGLLVLSFMFGFMVVVIGHGSVYDIPFAWLLVFGVFTIFAAIFVLIIRLGGLRIEDQ